MIPMKSLTIKIVAIIKEIQGSQNILIIVHWITASQENRKMYKFTIAIITFSSAILCEERFLSTESQGPVNIV